MVVRELPTFSQGMCYVIEHKKGFLPDTIAGEVKITVQAMPDTEIEDLNVWLTSQYDYLGVVNGSSDSEPF